MSTEYPSNILIYFESHPEKFEIRSITPVKKTVYIIISLICVVFIVNPYIINGNGNYSWVIRCVFIMIFVIIGLLSMTRRIQYYNKETGGRITGPKIKMFDLSEHSESEIINLFDNRRFNQLLQLPSSENSKIQLSIFTDTKANISYYQLRKNLPTSDCMGITDVITVKN